MVGQRPRRRPESIHAGFRHLLAIRLRTPPALSMRRIGPSSRRDRPAATAKRIVWRWDAGRARARGLATARHRRQCVRGPRSPTRPTRRTARLANARTDPAPGRPSARRLLKRRSRGTTRRHRRVDARGLSHRHGITALTDRGTSRPSLPGLHPGRGSCGVPRHPTGLVRSRAGDPSAIDCDRS
jgi:hypothetical protein